ncbi:MAG: ribosome maturation factor RimM [Syntrophotaleaceae bacterium]
MNRNGVEPVLLGVVIGTHGLRGDLKVRALSPDFNLLLDVKRVLLRQGSKPDAVCGVRRSTVHKGNLILLRLAEFETVEEAEWLNGAEVLAYREDLPAPVDGKRFWFQLQGLTAIDRQLGELGVLEDLFQTGAHDIYVVQGPYGEVMIPAVPQFIVEVDEEQGRILFDLPEGLVPKNDDL